MTHQLTLSLGSNQHPREVRVREAIAWLFTQLSHATVSDVYETPEIHGIGCPYMNAVVTGSIDADTDDFNAMLKEFELSHGRDMESRKRGCVPIDLDIVMCDGDVVRPRDFSHSFFQIGYRQIAGEDSSTNRLKLPD